MKEKEAILKLILIVELQIQLRIISSEKNEESVYKHLNLLKKRYQEL